MRRAAAPAVILAAALVWAVLVTGTVLRERGRPGAGSPEELATATAAAIRDRDPDALELLIADRTPHGAERVRYLITTRGEGVLDGVPDGRDVSRAYGLTYRPRGEPTDLIVVAGIGVPARNGEAAFEARYVDFALRGRDGRYYLWGSPQPPPSLP